MQPLIQYNSHKSLILTFFDQRFSDFSWKNYTWKQIKKKKSCKSSFWSEVFKKCLNMLFCFQKQLLQFWSLNLWGFDPGLKQAQDKPSNLSSALILTKGQIMPYTLLASPIFRPSYDPDVILENSFRTDQNKQKRLWKKYGFVDSRFVKTCHYSINDLNSL